MTATASTCDHGKPPDRPCPDCRYRDRVAELEEEGLTTGDAQGIADLEVAAAGRWAERRDER